MIARKSGRRGGLQAEPGSEQGARTPRGRLRTQGNNSNEMGVHHGIG